VQLLRPYFLNLKRALDFVWESGRGLTLANITLAIVQGVLPLLILYLIKLIVDAVTDGLQDSHTELVFERVAWLIALAAAVAVVGALCNILSTLVTRVHSQAVTDHMSAILHAKSLEIDLEYYENSQYYDTLHRAQQDAPTRPRAILEALLQIGQNSLSLLAIVGVLWWLHWAIVFVLLAAAIPGFVLRLRYADKLYRWRRHRTPTERQAWYLNWMLTRDTHAKEIRLFDLGVMFQWRFKEIRRNLRKERMNLEVRHSLVMLGAQAIATTASFGLLVFVAYRTLQRLLSIGDLVMYFGVIQRGAGALQALGDGLSKLYANNLFLSNFFEFLALSPKIANPATPKLFPRPLEKGLVFDQVTFRYSKGGGERWFKV